MNKNTAALRKRLTAITILFSALALALAVFRGWLITTHFDEETLFWNQGDPIPVIYTYATYAVVVAAYLIFFLFRKKISDRAPARNRIAVRISALFAGVFSIAASGMQLMQLVEGVEIKRGRAFFILSAVFLLISAVYFFFCLVFQKEQSGVRAVIGFFVPIAYIMLLLLSYFEISLVTNNPAKVSEMLCLILLVFWFMTELRFEVGSPKPALFFAAGWAAMVMIAGSVLPNLYAAFVLSRTMTLGLYSQIAELGILIYLTCRLFSASKEAEAKEEETADPSQIPNK